MDWLHYPVSQALVGLHDMIAPFAGPASGLTWVLMIVLLAIGIRIALLPFHLKQWHAQQHLGRTGPKVKELNAEFQARVRELAADQSLSEDERRRLVSEEQVRHVQSFRRVGQEGGVRWRNLFIPILVQGLVGILLFRVMRSFESGGEPRYGIPSDVYRAAVEAEILGAPISVSATTGAAEILALDAVPAVVRVVALGLIALITAASLISYKESVRRNRKIAAATNAGSGPTELEQRMEDKLRKLPYILFGFLALVYLVLPIGLLVAALTTTVWMAVYQQILLRRLERQRSEECSSEGEDPRTA